MGLNIVQLCLIWPSACLKVNILSAMEEESRLVEPGHLHTNVLAPPGTRTWAFLTCVFNSSLTDEHQVSCPVLTVACMSLSRS